MTPTSAEIGVRPEVFNSTGEVYVKLLGLDHMPKTPEDLPSEVRLTPQSLGDLSEVVGDGITSWCEESQLVTFDPKAQQYKSSKVFSGTSTGSGSEVGLEMLKRAFGGHKALLFYHTHPQVSPDFGTTFSSLDIKMSNSYPRLAYIWLVVGRNDVVALMQTEQGSKLPLSSFAYHFGKHQDDKFFSDLKKDILAGIKLKPEILSDFAAMVEANGYGYYHFSKDAPEWQSLTYNRINAQDLKNGITLPRIYPNKV